MGVRILGIDPGTATTGWAIVEERKGEIKTIAYGHIATLPQKSTAERLKEIASDLKKIIQKYQPQEASVEDLFYFKNAKTVIKVSQSRGAILLTLEDLGISIAEYTPLQVKQAISGYGRAEKKQVQLMVKNILKLSQVPQPDDTADALAIALCHWQSRKMRELEKEKINSK